MKLKEIIIKLFDKCGYQLVNKRHLLPIDQRDFSNNPKSLNYYTTTNKQVLVNAKLEDGRGLEIFSLGCDSSHPFIYAIRKAINNDNQKEVIKKILKKYYDTVQPKNTSEWLGLKENQAPLLDREPPWVSLLPWENTDLKNKKQGRKECAIYDNKEHGENCTIEKGWRNFGPVTDRILELETERLYKLMMSVKEKGFLRDDKYGGDIGGVVLINDDEKWKWIVEWGGQHRAAVISALGYNQVPIRVWQVIERKDVKIWPGVQSGIYSEKAALKIFDNIFYNKVSNLIYKDWINE